MKNSADLRQCYPPRPSASVDNTLFDLQNSSYPTQPHSIIGPSQDPVTWYGINYAGTQIMQWDFQDKGKSGWTGKSSFVLEVPLRYLCPTVIYFRTM